MAQARPLTTVLLQEELASVERQLNQQQQSSLADMKKQGWEAADWKAKALAANQKLAGASAQVSMHWSHNLHVCSAIGE